MKIIFTVFIFCFMIIGCSKNQENSSEFITINNKGIFPNTLLMVFLSNEKGEIISCASLNSGDIVTFQDSIYKETEVLNLSYTLISKSLDDDNIKINTLTNIKKNGSYSLAGLTTGGYNPLSQKKVIFISDTIPNNIEHVVSYGCIADSTLINFGGHMPIKFNGNTNYLLLYVKMTDENYYRYKEFYDLSNNDTILLEVNTYPKIEFDTFFSNPLNDIKINYLRESDSGDIFICPYDNLYEFAERKIWYPPNTSKEYTVSVEAKRDSFQCHLLHIGDPIFMYDPIFPNIEIMGNENGFTIETEEKDIDLVLLTWNSKEQNSNVEWSIYIDPANSNSHLLPDFPECLYSELLNGNERTFNLHNIESNYWENIDNYNEYIESIYTEINDESFGSHERKIIYK